MAKTFVKENAVAEFDGISVGQMFNTLTTINQIGDQFYVPVEGNLLIKGTLIPPQDGRPARQAGQRFFAVRLIDGVPTEVVELYVGQIVKTDIRGRVVFPGELANALRRGDKAFKNVICNRILEITGEQQIEDRVWDSETQSYLRNETDNKWVPQTKMALKFEPKMLPPKFDVAKAEALLQAYYQQEFPSLINEE